MLPWESSETKKIVVRASEFVELLFAITPYNKLQNSLSDGSSTGGSSSSGGSSNGSIDHTLAVKYQQIIEELMAVPNASNTSQPPFRAYIRILEELIPHFPRDERYLKYLRGDDIIQINMYI